MMGIDMPKKQDAQGVNLPLVCPVCFTEYTSAICPNEQRTHGTLTLCYIGDGSALDDVPARDLTDWDIRAVDRAALIGSGLYAEPSNDTPHIAPESEA